MPDRQAPVPPLRMRLTAPPALLGIEFAVGSAREGLQRIPEVRNRSGPINPRELSAGNPAFIGKLCQPAVAGLRLP